MPLATAVALALSVAVGRCEAAPQGKTIATAPGVHMHVRTVGAGRPLLYIPSLGRPVDDFDEVAGRLAARGYMAILPDPRGIGGSSGPDAANLFELANDYEVLLATYCTGPVGVVGHAFGNRVARALATAAPDRVSAVALLAGGGEVELSAAMRAALLGSTAQGQKPDDQRLKDLQTAFFAKGADPSVWLTGWSPKAAGAQSAATRATPTAQWWTAGRAPVLLIQAVEDPIAPAGNGEALKRDIGKRLTLVSLQHASHAILPEQPGAVTEALSAYFDGERSAAKLQAVIDRATKAPGQP